MNVVMAVAYLLIALLSACTPVPESGPAPATEVSIVSISPRPASVTIEYVAQTEAFKTIEIRPRVGGLLERQDVVEGSHVKQGQVLFTIDARPYIAARAEARAAVAQAVAAMDKAEHDHSRTLELAKSHSVSDQAVDATFARRASTRAAVEAAKAALSTAELNVEYATLKSPIDGIVGRAQIRVGGLVTAYSTLLTTVYGTNPMYVNFSISERRMLELQHRFGITREHPDKSQVFHVVLADGSKYSKPAKLNYIGAAVDATTGTLPVRLLVDNPDGELLAGQFARVVVETDRIADALLIPQRAVQELQGKTWVWVVDEDDNVQPRDVALGVRIESDWLVLKGLKVGDRVVVGGAQKLKAGMPVAVQSAANDDQS